MTPPSETGPRALTASQYAVLAGHAGRVASAADDSQRETATAAAVQAARRYRKRGAGWRDIARALGIPEATLREWRGNEGRASKMRPGLGTGQTTGRSAQAAVHARTRSPLRPMAYLALGSMKANGNDFACEVAMIRRMLRLRKIEVTERYAVEISELLQDVSATRPAIVHVAAHFSLGSVHLSLDGEAAAILTHDLCRVIKSATAPPDLVVLNGCDTWTYAEQLTRPDAAGIVQVPAAVGWHGQVTDAQARLFAERFYGQLASGDDVGTAFEAPALTITAQWPGQGEPRLFGLTGTTPLPYRDHAGAAIPANSALTTGD